eukprot:1144601-Pelagomonas_calceolata.AAC.6
MDPLDLKKPVLMTAARTKPNPSPMHTDPVKIPMKMPIAAQQLSPHVSHLPPMSECLNTPPKSWVALEPTCILFLDCCIEHSDLLPSLPFLFLGKQHTTPIPTYPGIVQALHSNGYPTNPDCPIIMLMQVISAYARIFLAACWRDICAGTRVSNPVQVLLQPGLQPGNNPCSLATILVKPRCSQDCSQAMTFTAWQFSVAAS